MKKQQDINHNIYYRILNYCYWFLILNILVFVGSLPVLVLIQFQWNLRNIFFWILLILCLAPLGPVITASLSVMGKLVRENQVSIMKDFFKALKDNFSQSLFIWILQTLISAVLLVDINFLADKNIWKYLNAFFFVALFVNVLIGLYIYPILSRFVVSNSSLLRISVGFAFLKIKTTLFLLLLLGITGLIVIFLPFISIFFLTGPLCFVVMYILSGLLEELESRIKA
ncbi:YesL family protein [Sporolactobacillus sp. THM19-2]|uniref:YesL family protein n=1 Tax=Sporolactobacillus sp. THM19-2 TaxID=2511171 RepID=UPI00102248A4|nr:YesL family protein [Sporolactobacillus sp. THM19-2]RYL86664.1 DUF624 domain-containing protein [Sporolactobacillus sp. THM19-2]